MDILNTTYKGDSEKTEDMSVLVLLCNIKADVDIYLEVKSLICITGLKSCETLLCRGLQGFIGWLEVSPALSFYLAELTENLQCTFSSSVLVEPHPNVS